MHRLVAFLSYLLLHEDDILESKYSETALDHDCNRCFTSTFDVHLLSKTNGTALSLRTLFARMRVASLCCSNDHKVTLTIFAAMGTLIDLVSAINEDRGCVDYFTFFERLLCCLGGKQYVKLLLENVHNDPRYEDGSDDSKCISQHLESLFNDRPNKSDGYFDFQTDYSLDFEQLDPRLRLRARHCEVFFRQILALADLPSYYTDTDTFPAFWEFWRKQRQEDSVSEGYYTIGMVEVTSFCHEFFCFTLIDAMSEACTTLPKEAAQLLGLDHDPASFGSIDINPDHFVRGGAINLFGFGFLERSTNAQPRWIQYLQGHLRQSFDKTKTFQEWPYGNSLSRMAIMICLCAQLDDSLGTSIRSLIESTTDNKEACQLIRCVYGWLGVNNIFFASAIKDQTKAKGRANKIMLRAVGPSVMESVCMVASLDAICDTFSNRDSQEQVIDLNFVDSVIERPTEAEGIHFSVATSSFKIQVDPDPDTNTKGIKTKSDAFYIAALVAMRQFVGGFVPPPPVPGRTHYNGNVALVHTDTGTFTGKVRRHVSRGGFQFKKGCTAGFRPASDSDDPNSLRMGLDLRDSLPLGTSFGKVQLGVDAAVLESCIAYPSPNADGEGEATDADVELQAEEEKSFDGDVVDQRSDLDSSEGEGEKSDSEGGVRRGKELVHYSHPNKKNLDLLRASNNSAAEEGGGEKKLKVASLRQNASEGEVEASLLHRDP